MPALLLSSEIGARETRDADHVIGLQSWAAWENVIAGLETLGFTRGRGEQEHRLYYRTAEIDLIPYGVSDGPEDVLIWPRSGNHMNMTGFGDVFRYAVPTEVSPGITVPVVPLWLFAVLKVIAFLDRQFPRDLRDLVYVFEHYEPIGQSARRFEVLGNVDTMTVQNAGAYLLGRDVRAHASMKALDLVGRFLAQITDEYHPAVNTVLREENRLFSDERRHEVVEFFTSFRMGLT